MSFTDEQRKMLEAPLDRTNVKTRAQAGRQLSYIEGWWAIHEANRIFGFDKWSRELREMREAHPPRQVGDKWYVGFSATVRITVNMPDLRDVIRDGTGFGSGIDKDYGRAVESAAKEAETDAMKRALMTFGNPFGLALYDKQQREVVDEPVAQSQAAPQERTAEHHRKITDTMKESLRFVIGQRSMTEWELNNSIEFDKLPEAYRREIENAKAARIAELKRERGAA